MSLRPDKATTLAHAIKNLDHNHALEVSELQQYFVSRDASIIQRMGRNLLYDYPQKYLFTGHRGTGKSTELAKFEQEYGDKFFIVRYSVEQVLDLYDITYVDVLLSIALETFKVALDNDIPLDKARLEKLWSFGKDIEIEQDESHAVSLEAEVGLGGIGAALGSLFNLSGRIGTESATREAVRERVRYRISDLLEGIASLKDSIHASTDKDVVCIVEDLDKADIETSRKIFYDFGKSIASPDIAIIYTFPAALQHSDDFMQINAYFSDDITLPNFRTYTQQGQPDVGMGQLQSLIHQRLDAGLLAEDALERLITASGGIPRILLQLVKDAALEADIDGANVITLAYADVAINRERQHFQRMLSREQLKNLGNIRAIKKIDQTPEYQLLLHNLSVLEYVDDNKDVWYNINPLVETLLT